jgi:WD40 repeat protein
MIPRRMPGERLDYENERRRHEAFVGRAALLARLDQWLLTDGTDRWVVVTGGPGMGKSALLAAWLAQCEAAGVPVPHHFIRRGQYDWDDPARLVGSLVAQLEEAFPGAREPDGDARWHPATRLSRALTRVSRVLAPRRNRLVVLMDGLDEYDPPAGAAPGDPLAAFLPHVLPDGVRILCASRPRHPYLASLAAREGELVSIDLDAPDSAADNEATVRAYWEREARLLGLDSRFVDEAVARAGGNLQHAVQLRKRLAVLPATQRRVEAIPHGLAALHERTWERIASDTTIAQGLGILCAAREALTLDEIGAVAGWSGDAQRRQFLRGAKELLVETRRRVENIGHAPNGELDEARRADKRESVREGLFEYRLHHDSIRRYIAEVIGERALRAHHGALAQRLAMWPTTGDAAARRYALRHALNHRAEAGDLPDTWRVAGDTSFLEARLRELGMDEPEADVARIAQRCRAMGDDVHGRRFDDLARALARDSHWLRADPAATAVLVWNRLRRRGWSTNELDVQLRVPTERASFLRIRHATMRESPALVRDLVSDGSRGMVRDCAVTPDGRRVISASVEGLTVWDLETGRLLALLKDSNAHLCAVSPDGRRAISASGLTLTIWDLETGRPLVTLETHEVDLPELMDSDDESARGFLNQKSARAFQNDYGSNLLTACAVTRDGRVLSASAGGKLKVWDLETRHLLTTLEGHSNRVTACAITPDGRRAVSASSDHTLRVWDLETGTPLTILEGHSASVNACAMTPDGTRVVSASTDGTLKVWDLESTIPLVTVEGPTRERCLIRAVVACTVSPDGRRVVSASRDDTLKIWDLETGQTLTTLEGHSGRVNACVVTPDGRRVVSASDDGTLKVWDLEGYRSLESPEGHAACIGACAVTPDGRRAVSTSMDGTQKIWDLESGHLRSTMEGDREYVVPCAVTPDGQRMVSARRGRLNVCDLESGRSLASLGPGSWVDACVVSPDGRRVISASHEGILQVWDLDSGRSLATLRGHYASVCEHAMTGDGGFSSSTSLDGTVIIYANGSERVLATVQGYSDHMTACAVTPDGQRVVFATFDGVLKIWDLETGRTVATLIGHSGEVTACAVTPNGERVVSASQDGTLKIWNIATGAPLTTLKGHRGEVRACTLTPDGRRVISASEDRTVKVWELETRACVFTFRGDAEFTTVSASSTAIVAGDRAGGLWFLDVPRTCEHSPKAAATVKHTILFLAANPIGTDRLALDREARAIQAELERSGCRDRFDFATRWAAEPLDLLRELRKLRPAVVHFSGHGSAQAGDATAHARDVVESERSGGELEHGLYFQSPRGEPQWVSSKALADTFGAAGHSVKLVVLSACYSDMQAAALLSHVPCVVGMAGSIEDDAAQNFAIGFYGGLGEGESVARAYEQGCAAVSLMGACETQHPKLRVRPEVDASQLVLTAVSAGTGAQHRGGDPGPDVAGR